MDNKNIIDLLDKIDVYMLNNLDENNKLRNPNDSEVINFINEMKKLNRIIDNNDVPPTIIGRYDETDFAIREAIEPGKYSNSYYTWIKEIRNLYKDKDNIKTDDALDVIASDCITGHMPDNVALEYLNWEVEKMTKRQKQIWNNWCKTMSSICSQYQEFLDRDNKQIMTIPPKKSIFAKISDFFRKIRNKEEKTNYKDNQYEENDNAASKYRQSMRQKNFKQQPIEPKKYEEQHIVISDLHGKMDRWESVKQAMQQNPNMHVTILGDAMDRGDYGLEILLQIKELSDQGRVDYLPGNHDVFAYNYVATKDILDRMPDEHKRRPGNEKLISIAGRETKHLMMNGGEQTIEGLENFEQIVKKELKQGNIKNNITKESLMNWLGNQPIQKKVQINGIEYALAHAYFDEDLYNYDKNFNLQEALHQELMGQEKGLLNKFKTSIWYREGDSNTQYAQVTFPKDCVMVVGHTPQQEVNVGKLQQDPYKTIIYVDTGKGEFAGWNLTKASSIEFNTREQDDFLQF